MLRSLTTTILGLIWAVILVLTGGRFLALLANANRESEIIERLYRHSDFWVKPFFGILDLSNETVARGGTFEPASLIAFLVYLLLGGLVISLVNGAPFTRLHHA